MSALRDFSSAAERHSAIRLQLQSCIWEAFSPPRLIISLLNSGGTWWSTTDPKNWAAWAESNSMYMNIGERSLSYLPTRRTSFVCNSARHTSFMLRRSSAILAPEWTVCAGSDPLGKGPTRTMGQSIIVPGALCRIAAGSRGWSALLSACCGHCGRVMLTVTGPSCKGIRITVLRARRRPVASILTRRRESGESGETCSFVFLEPLPPVDMLLTLQQQLRANPQVRRNPQVRHRSCCSADWQKKKPKRKK